MSRKLPPKRNDFLAKLAYPSSVMRLIIPLFIFNFPAVVVVLSWILDTTDHGPYRALGLTRAKYELIDKTLDFYWYSVSLFYAYFHLPLFNLLLVLFVIRLAGQILFYLSRKEIYFIIFPNFYEFLLWLLIFLQFVPKYNFLLDASYIQVTLLVLGVLKFLQELVAHKFDKYYYPYVPDWAKAPK